MLSLSKWDPFLSPSLMNELFRTHRPAKKTWAPSVNVTETPEAYLLDVELPGLDPKDIELTLEDGVLTLKGERTREETREEETVHIVERSYGSFQRTFNLPLPVEGDGVKAESKNGLLKVFVPKQAKAQSRKIEVIG